MQRQTHSGQYYKELLIDFLHNAALQRQVVVFYAGCINA